MPSAPQIIVIVVDRLGSGWLGPYGNTWVATPALNRLAAHSLLCEFMISDSHDLAAVYRSYWSGTPAWRTAGTMNPTLPQVARAANYETCLVTDAAEIAHHPLAGEFEQVDLLTWTRPARKAAETQQTRLAEVFAAASEALARTDKPKLLWIHAAAMNAAWDAPLELRERVAGEEDPTPQDFVAPPSVELARDYDPDFLFGIAQAYAAEVMALDENLATLLAAVDAACDPAKTLLIFTSPRGYALGEHLRVGATGDALRGELLQVPLLIRYPGRAERLTRAGGLHQPIDLYATIAAHMDGSLSEQDVILQNQAHPTVVSATGDELSLRTAHWFYRQRGTGEERRAELFAKPDDRWEVNEVSQRASDVVEGFQELAVWLEVNRDLPEPPGLPPLPESIATARR